jgi:uncharacterized membrane protein HdeD (DUF308 family)
VSPETETRPPPDPTGINPLDPDPPPAAVVREHRGWFVALGVVQVLAGMVALGMAVAATLVAVLVIGGLALAGAAVQLLSVFWSRSAAEGTSHAIMGVLYGAFGLVVLGNPGLAITTLTLVLAILLLVGGVTRVAFAAAVRYRGWGWAAAGGAVAALLGGLIWADWPENSAWVIGLFVGIDLLVMGWYWVTVALAVRAAAPPGDAAA